MNTREMADAIGVQPRELRQFLRSPMSIWKAVGSGARYEFKPRDVEPVRRRFAEWKGSPKPKPAPKVETDPPLTNGKPPEVIQHERDLAVWIEEGTATEWGVIPIDMPNLNDPKVRAAVRRAEAERIGRLEMRLMAVGLHVTQWGDR